MGIRSTLQPFGGQQNKKLIDNMTDNGQPVSKNGWEVETTHNMQSASEWSYGSINAAMTGFESRGGGYDVELRSVLRQALKLKTCTISFQFYLHNQNDGYPANGFNYFGVTVFSEPTLSLLYNTGIGLAAYITNGSGNAELICNGVKISNSISINRTTWYEVEIKISKSKASATIWQEGTIKPAQPNLISNVAFTATTNNFVKISGYYRHVKGYVLGAGSGNNCIKNFRLIGK